MGSRYFKVNLGMPEASLGMPEASLGMPEASPISYQSMAMATLPTYSFPQNEAVNDDFVEGPILGQVPICFMTFPYISLSKFSGTPANTLNWQGDQ